MRQATTRHGVILMLTAVMPTMAIIALVPVLPLLLREFADVPGAAVLVPMALIALLLPSIRKRQVRRA